jgi:thioredoxin-related protein
MRTLLIAVLIAAQSGVAAQKYDPARNAQRDLSDAMVAAQKSGKRILLEVGGNWCSWCHVLDKYFKANTALTTGRDRYFVTLKINVSPENENKAVLSRYPAVPGYPHFFVLDSDGRLLHSQATFQLENGSSYDLPKFTAFLEKWAPPGLKVQ